MYALLCLSNHPIPGGTSALRQPPASVSVLTDVDRETFEFVLHDEKITSPHAAGADVAKKTIQQQGLFSDIGLIKPTALQGRLFRPRHSRSARWPGPNMSARRVYVTSKAFLKSRDQRERVGCASRT
jgi:hypothetical protein